MRSASPAAARGQGRRCSMLSTALTLIGYPRIGQGAKQCAAPTPVPARGPGGQQNCMHAIHALLSQRALGDHALAQAAAAVRLQLLNHGRQVLRLDHAAVDVALQRSHAQCTAPVSQCPCCALGMYLMCTAAPVRTLHNPFRLLHLLSTSRKRDRARVLHHASAGHMLQVALPQHLSTACPTARRHASHARHCLTL